MSSNPKTISLLTFNILHFPTIPYISAKTYHKRERLKVMAEKFRPYDIVCLQEMYRPLSQNLDMFLVDLKKSGFEYFYIIDLNGHFTQFLSDGGVMIVSKFPIKYAEQVQWPTGIKQDAACSKGGIYCMVELPNGKTLHLIDIHVQATYKFDPDAIQAMTVVVRQQQFNILKQWILTIFSKFHVKRQDMFVMCGDFNMDALYMNKPIKEYIKSVSVEGVKEGSADLIKLRESENLYSFFINFMMMNNDKFELENVYYNQHNEFPITYGELNLDSKNNRVQEETYLTDEEEFFNLEALDYIFVIKPTAKYSKSIKDTSGKNPRVYNQKESRIKMVPKSSKIEKFKHKIEGTPVTQLSDHFGISCRIQIE